MAILKQHNYPNGAKLLLFVGGGMKYIPSPAYTAHVEKHKAGRHVNERTNSTRKNVSKLIDTLFKVPADQTETGLCKDTFSVLKKDTKGNERQRPVFKIQNSNSLAIAK